MISERQSSGIGFPLALRENRPLIDQLFAGSPYRDDISAGTVYLRFPIMYPSIESVIMSCFCGCVKEILMQIRAINNVNIDLKWAGLLEKYISTWRAQKAPSFGLESRA